MNSGPCPSTAKCSSSDKHPSACGHTRHRKRRLPRREAPLLHSRPLTAAPHPSPARQETTARPQPRPSPARAKSPPPPSPHARACIYIMCSTYITRFPPSFTLNHLGNQPPLGTKQKHLQRKAPGERQHTSCKGNQCTPNKGYRSSPCKGYRCTPFRGTMTHC